MIQFDWYSFDGLKPQTRGSLLRVLSPAIGGLCWKSRLIFSFWTSLLGTNISPTSWALLSDSQILLFPRWDRWNSVEGNKREITPKSSIWIGFSIIFTIHFGVPLVFGNHPNGELKNPKHPTLPPKKTALKLIRLRFHISTRLRPRVLGVKSGDPWRNVSPETGPQENLDLIPWEINLSILIFKGLPWLLRVYRELNYPGVRLINVRNVLYVSVFLRTKLKSKYYWWVGSINRILF